MQESYSKAFNDVLATAIADDQLKRSVLKAHLEMIEDLENQNKRATEQFNNKGHECNKLRDELTAIKAELSVYHKQANDVKEREEAVTAAEFKLAEHGLRKELAEEKYSIVREMFSEVVRNPTINRAINRIETHQLPGMNDSNGYPVISPRVQEVPITENESETQT